MKSCWWLVLLASLVAGPAWSQSDDLEQFVSLGGDSLSVRFEPVCASRLSVGDVIPCEVAEAKTARSRVLIAEGAPVRARVVEVQSPGRPGKPGMLRIAVESVVAESGAEIPLTMEPPLARKGGGRNIIAKILTLFLIKGQDPCLLSDEVFHPKFPANALVFLPRT